MPIDFEGAKVKVNELNLIAIKIVDMLTILERGTLIDTPLNSVTLTETQIGGLKLSLESCGNTLKVVAGEVKALVKE